MYIKKTTFALLLLFSSMTTFSQEKENSNSGSSKGTSFFAELGGPGILFSANLDKRFSSSQFGWGGRAGLGFVSGYIVTDNLGNYNNPASVVTLPIQINYIFGKTGSSHTFEVGGGFTVAGKKIEIMDFYDEKGGTNFFGTASFMYRRQPADGGFIWRVGFTPLIAKGYIQAFVGVSVGYSF